MAKQRSTKASRARTSAAADDDSLLVRSAESLGRVIGSLQRGVTRSTARASSLATDAVNAVPKLPRIGKKSGGHTPARTGTGAAKTAATKGAAPRGATARKTATAAGARKATGGTKRAAPKSTARGGGSRKRPARSAGARKGGTRKR